MFTAPGMWPEAYSPAERTSIHWNSRGTPVLGTSSAAVMVFIGPECPLSMKSLDFAKRIQGRTNNVHIGGLWQVPQSAPTRAGSSDCLVCQGTSGEVWGGKVENALGCVGF